MREWEDEWVGGWSPDEHWETDEEVDGVEERAVAIHGRLVNESVILELQSHRRARDEMRHCI